ncbi:MULTISPECIES: ROK family transcriptional regulator [unclassified Leifsonia]|uniref:ROK family transcriptional regulator n=1 Tax=unclassified Leifsonia TaxID=2663824 RepID=UPI0008A7F9BC|nr:MULTISPECIES: ROK family transcriptional regulator [unclassified Leifsonia]SEH75488.1 Sugar kinase of the NBD/HSP70 family, may contain an N-terminal HTH domain [Leifsonia sp. CL154]SFL36940.1 Sugar kinase of the NBD/HSP70 family, may contain an N-terminal HTH domain [Leifsonia sp. CL147]
MVIEQGRRDAADRGAQLDGGLVPGRALRPRTKVLPEHARGHNRSLVLQSLYRSGRVSRADLARSTGLTRVTISDLVAELIAEGLVVELGQRDDARPGKPAVLLDVDRSATQIIGVDLSEHAVFRGAVLDIDGRILDAVVIELAGTRGQDATDKVLTLVDRLVALATAPVLGIGIGSPGIVDAEGTVAAAPNLGWADEPLQRLLAQRTGLPVFVANDANVAVLAEHGFADAQGDMMLVKVGHGVGSGLLVAGALVFGSRFAAGEIGQVIVGTDEGPDAPYDREHSLEAWLAVPRLERRLATATAAGRPAEQVLREAGQRLGVALAPVVGALNLSELVLAGPEDLLDGIVLEAFRETLRNRTMAGFHSGVTVRMTSQGRDIVLRGCVVMVLSAQLGVS